MGRTPTIHNQAKKGEIAPFVLMPGDPKRAVYIAENFMDDASLVSDVRGIPVYTGRYDGIPVSVMASGMGCGSMGIYSYELYHDYDVQSIIRVGTAGGLQPEAGLKDIVMALSVSTDSGFDRQFRLPAAFSPCASLCLVTAVLEAAKKRSLPVKGGMFFSGAAFHYPDDYLRCWQKAGALAVEMETAALYMNAAYSGREALTLCTITDNVFGEQHCTVLERQEGLDIMIGLALQTLADRARA